MKVEGSAQLRDVTNTVHAHPALAQARQGKASEGELVPCRYCGAAAALPNAPIDSVAIPVTKAWYRLSDM